MIDTRTDKIVETICARQNPADLFGAQPNALAFDKTGKTLFVCNGTQNAVAVFHFKPGKSKLLGLIPVGWFPGSIAYDAKRKEIYVANIKSLAQECKATPAGNGVGFNTKQYYGSLSLVPVPSKKELAAFTRTALADLRYPLLAQAALPARPDQPARPVPERVGEPSVFQHVIYIIKENRTYDQVLGDVKEGNGDADLCMFGESRHAQPAQARPRFRAAGQHLLLQHPERRRPSMGGHGHRDGLRGARVCRLAAQLSGGRLWRGRPGRAGLFAGGFHLERRARARQNRLRFRRIHHRPQTMEGCRPQRRTEFSRLLPRFSGRLERHRLFLRAGHRVAAALSW